MGFEPTTSDLEGQRSTTELHPHIFIFALLIPTYSSNDNNQNDEAPESHFSTLLKIFVISIPPFQKRTTQMLP